MILQLQILFNIRHEIIERLYEHEAVLMRIIGILSDLTKLAGFGLEKRVSDRMFLKTEYENFAG